MPTAATTTGSGQSEFDTTEVGNCADCNFDGTVTVTIDDRGIGHWNCPSCGEEGEMDWLNEPDPDDAYDRMRDERDGF